MESKFHELKNRLLKNIDQTSESRLYMDIQLAQNCETLMSIIKKDIGYLAKEGILSPGIAEDFKDVFLSAGIKCNSGGSSGYMLIWDGTAVDISGTATAVIWKSERAFIKGRACAFLLGEVSAITCERSMVIAAGSSTILAEGDSVVGVSGYHASVKASDYATVVNMNCPNIDLRDNTRLWLPARGSFAARKNCDIINVSSTN